MKRLEAALGPPIRNKAPRRLKGRGNSGYGLNRQPSEDPAVTSPAIFPLAFLAILPAAVILATPAASPAATRAPSSSRPAAAARRRA
ncbi:hypothetical protein ACKI2N_028225 [Cupriavidus sp. 30B13]|uniref:hypothetical protein n=1 Tax=Cupriavidus sp. 30B13 TaxID=3384241 RepID=UPI003B91520E